MPVPAGCRRCQQFRAKHVILSRIRIINVLLGEFQRLLQTCRQHTPLLSQVIQRAGADECFNNAPVDLARVNTPAEFKQVGELPMFLPFFTQAYDRGPAYSLDSPQPEQNCLVINNPELMITGIYRWRLQDQFHPSQFFNQPDNPVRVIHVRRQHGSHKCCRIMGLQPGCLVGKQCIGDGVGFVETVTGKFFHKVKDGCGCPLVDLVVQRAADENISLQGHLFTLFLSHRPPQQIRRSQCIASQHPGNLHHLLLVEYDSVGRFQHRFQGRVKITDLCLALFPVYEIIDHPRIQRAGTKQCYQGNQVIEFIRLKPFNQFLHSVRFQLEYGGGIHAPYRRISIRIIEGNGFYIQFRGGLVQQFVIDVLDRPIDNSQGPQPEKIELDQADGFHIAHVKLCRRYCRVLFTVQRHEFRQRRG